MVSYEYGVMYSSQRHLCSTCVLGGSESCRVIQACLYQMVALKPKKAIKPYVAIMFITVLTSLLSSTITWWQE